MKARTQTTIGKVTYYFEFSETDDKETLHKAIVLSNPPRYCNVCKNTEYFKLDSNKDKEGNVYINMVCTKDSCFAKAKLGSYKVGGYFFHKFERYGPKNKTSEQKQEQPPSSADGFGAENVEWDE